MATAWSCTATWWRTASRPCARSAPSASLCTSSNGCRNLVERQHRAGDLPRLHRPERVVDVVEPPPAADHLVEQESPLAVELEVERDVDAEAVGAHPRRLHPTLRADGHPGELDLRVRREDTHDGRRAPDRQTLDGLPHQSRVPDGLEGMVHPCASGERADGLHRVVLRAVDDVSRAHSLGHLELGLEHVDADDLSSAADARALDDRQPDAAAAEHGHRLPGLQPRGAQRRSDPCEDATADERGPVERQVGVDLHHRVLVEQHALGVAADADELSERLALLGEPRGPRLRTGDDTADAEVRVAGEALRAAPAEAGETGHHVIAGTQGGHLRAHRLDDAGALVAEDVWSIQRKPPEPIHDVEVAVADARRGGADEDLAAPRLVDVYRFDRQRLVDLPGDPGPYFHVDLLLASRNRGVAPAPAPRNARAVSARDRPAAR